MDGSADDGPRPDADVPDGDPEEAPSVVDRIREWSVVLVGAVVLAVVLRTFVLQVFWIPSESMQSTLLIHDKVVADKVTWHFNGIHRGDVVVFERPLNVRGDTDHLIKRVVALPGQTVEIRDERLWIDGEAQDEPYVDPGTEMLDFGPVEVPDGHLFMMGDNRDGSTDSRVFGPVSEDLVVGKARLLIWPLSRIDVL
jgi:signal peptidase I